MIENWDLNWVLRGIAVAVIGIAAVVIAVFVFAQNGDSSNGGGTVVPGAPGIEVYEVKTPGGVRCLVASNGGSSIALSCDWGG